MSIFGRKKEEKNKADDNEIIASEAEDTDETEMISEEILAVIAASIASMNTRHGYKLQVQAIRRIPHSSPVWNTTGRLERLGRNLNS